MTRLIGLAKTKTFLQVFTGLKNISFEKITGCTANATEIDHDFGFSF